MEQIERIKKMELILDQSNEMIEKLQQTLETYQSMEGKIQELIQYYQSPIWLQDYEDEQNGKIPRTLKRDVLSEDGIYDMIYDLNEIHEQMQEIIKKGI